MSAETAAYGPATRALIKVREAAWFQNTITAAILLAGVVVGIETYPSMVDAYGGPLHLVNEIILWIFVAEIVVKMGAQGAKPWRYFFDAWNIFDFIIVAVCFMPFDAQYVAVLRLARLLRVLKLVTAVPKLQILVGALLKSIPSMFYVGVLLAMLFYVYAVASVFLFGANDPVHFKDLPISMLSLFRVVTGEDWTDVMYIQMFGCAEYGYEGMEALCTQSTAYPVFGALFFVSFMLLGAMVILNLFIGVIMSGMDEAKKETEALERAKRGEQAPTLDEEIHKLNEHMAAIQEQLAVVQMLAAKRDAKA